ncbi:hypothetical protein [Streptomyces sp. NPDC012508]|uniref:hypothetical protein n=1 Tax=Streptomyces sp. NPDC012508 TaxID=3364837 RepID=UPI003673A3ED
MRGPAAPMTPGPWDSRSEALLETTALTVAVTVSVTTEGPERPGPLGRGTDAGHAGSATVATGAGMGTGTGSGRGAGTDAGMGTGTGTGTGAGAGTNAGSGSGATCRPDPGAGEWRPVAPEPGHARPTASSAGIARPTASSPSIARPEAPSGGEWRTEALVPGPPPPAAPLSGGEGLDLRSPGGARRTSDPQSGAVPGPRTEGVRPQGDPPAAPAPEAFEAGGTTPPEAGVAAHPRGGAPEAAPGGPGLGAPAPEAPGDVPPKPARRGPADPVKALMHRHRELCERAVDPLEIAAGLEAHGVTDRTAARFRHRDVFSLAEELYARVPRGTGAPARPAPEGEAHAGWAGWTLAALAPGAVAALTVTGLALTEGPVRLAVGAAGVLGLAAALAVAVRRGPLRAAGRTVPAARVWTVWLLAYALGGDGLLQATLTGGPDGAWPVTPAPLLGLALAVAPAAWCARLFAIRARRRLAVSRGLEDFAAGTRPVLLATVALHLAVLAGLLTLTGFAPGALALGTLFLLARLLTVHGFPETAASGLAAACAAEALALASVLTGRIPGCDLLAAPVRALVDTWGPGAVPALVCGGAALGLLVHATATLSRASAHAQAPAPAP